MLHQASKAAARAKLVGKPDACVFLIEPMAAEEDSIEQQLALPTAKAFPFFSCHVCLLCSKCDNGDALGTLCPTSRHRELFVAAGFSTLENLPSVANAMGFRTLLAM